MVMGHVHWPGEEEGGGHPRMESWAIEPEAERMSYKVTTAGAPKPTTRYIIPCHWWVVWVMEDDGGGTTMNINVMHDRLLSRS